MSERPVYQTGKDQWGNVVSLCGPWGRASHVEAIEQIERLLEQYFVPLNDGSAAPIEVSRGPLGAYLRANWDGQQRNNLADLADC